MVVGEKELLRCYSFFFLPSSPPFSVGEVGGNFFSLFFSVVFIPLTVEVKEDVPSFIFLSQ